MPPRVQQDASLAFDLSGKGVTNDEIIKAVDKSHIGPSVGDTAKIHGDVKARSLEVMSQEGIWKVYCQRINFQLMAGSRRY